MNIVGQVIATLLWIYWLLFIARLVLDLVASFSRGFRPTGILLVIAEAVFTVTDPPLKLLRRFIPPLRLGSIQFDLGFIIVLVLLQVLMRLALLL